MHMAIAKKNVVPKSAENPISYLMDKGVEVLDLATAWKFKQTETVYRLRRFAHVPSYATAERMATTFGWDSAGEVMDFWSERVNKKGRTA